MSASLPRIGLVLLLACGCASSTPATREPTAEAPSEWNSHLYRNHPLVGKIWDVRHDRWVQQSALEAELARTRFVLLGEKHDNPDHHRLQARLVEALSASGRKPTLAFEMLDVEQQPAVDAALAQAPKDADALARTVAWERSGWPSWSLYRPIFAAGLEHGLHIVGANLPRSKVKQLVAQGPQALDAETRARLGLDTALPPAIDQAMRAEMRESHCGQLPEAMEEPMVLAQRARDAQMADRLVSTASADGALLITGAGHARTDRGVPAQLARRVPQAPVRSLVFVEVSPGALTPQDYTSALESPGALPYDYVWFTPAQQRDDPCGEFHLAPPGKSPGK